MTDRSSKEGKGLMARYNGLDPEKFVRIREAAIALIYERGEEKVLPSVKKQHIDKKKSAPNDRKQP